MDQERAAAIYEFRLRGVLGETLLSAFPALSGRADNGITVLSGRLPDQAALHGVLGQIDSLGLELVAMGQPSTKEGLMSSAPAETSDASAAPGRFILRGGRIVSMDPAVGDLPVGDVLIDDGRIAAIASELHVEGVATVDVGGKIVMPGFVDSHRHMWEGSLRGRSADASLGGYFGWVLATVAPAFSPDDIYASTHLSAVEALDAGVTSVFDWCNATNSPAHADAAIDALTASGMRAVFAHGNPEDASDVRRLRDRLGETGRVTLGLAIAGPEFGSVDAAAADIGLARELGLIASMHIGCGTNGPRATGVSGLAAAGLLGPDLNFVHCNTISDAEIGLIVESGSGVSITPLVESLMGHGMPALGRFLKAGGDPSVGVDVSVASGADLFGQMRAGLALSRMTSNQEILDSGGDPDTVWPHARALLHAATLAGARAVGLADRVGSLTVGKAADIVILEGAGLPADAEQLVGAIVTVCDASDVDSVLVGGRFVKRDGDLVDHDLRALRSNVASSVTV